MSKSQKTIRHSCNHGMLVDLHKKLVECSYSKCNKNKHNDKGKEYNRNNNRLAIKATTLESIQPSHKL